MKLSIVIPTFNSEKTLGECLHAVFDSDFKDFEVMVVDDGSRDRSIEIIKTFPCQIIHIDKNMGPSHARYAGQQKAQGEVIVFIDSDVVIQKSTLNELVATFFTKPDICAITGILSKPIVDKSFYGKYKNLYMHYIFQKCPDEVDFLYGSFYAVKKECLNDFWTKARIGEDTQLGAFLNERGCKIFLNKNLQITHLKDYSLLSLLKNDFLVPYYWSRLFCKHKGWTRIQKERRFFHARLSQLLGIGAASLGVLSILLSPLVFIVCVAGFIGANASFFFFMYKESCFIFMIKSVLFTWLDMCVMGIGIISGLISYLFDCKTTN